MHERHNFADKPPVPEQLSRLASVALGGGSAVNKLRPSSRINKAHFFVAEALFASDFDDESRGFRRVVSARIGKQTCKIAIGNSDECYEVGLPQWRMHMFDTQHFEHEDGDWVGSRSIYQFEWDSDHTTRATRTTRAVPTPADEFRIIDDLAAVKNYEILPEFIAMEDDYRNIADGDVDELISDLDEYFNALKSAGPKRNLLQ